MKDYIYVFNDPENAEKMELVCKFNLPNYPLNYIIYKSLDSKHYYLAKYKGDNLVRLDPNISDEELKLAQEVLERVK